MVSHGRNSRHRDHRQHYPRIRTFLHAEPGRGRATPKQSTGCFLAGKKAYLSFPMTHVADQPEILRTIEDFKRTIHAHFTCFDPSDVDEYMLHIRAIAAMQEGRTTIEVAAAEGLLALKTADVAQISGDILGQLYARDFKMIDQSDLILSIIPELPGGTPGLSGGVERELHHAFEGGKEVFVLWLCRAARPHLSRRRRPASLRIWPRQSIISGRRDISPSVPPPRWPPSCFLRAKSSLPPCCSTRLFWRPIILREKFRSQKPISKNPSAVVPHHVAQPPSAVGPRSTAEGGCATSF